ncbi:MAG: beta strand repeat-containing protein, partial [Ilumatobacteraceae bacterium]
ATGPTTLRFNFGDNGSDMFGLLAGGTLSLNPASPVTFFLTDIGAGGNTRYDLITSVGGGLLTGTSTLGAIPGGFTSFSLVTTDTAVYALSGNLITGTTFWNGSLGSAWNAGPANWSDNQAGTIASASIPGSGSDVVFVADTVTNTGTLATTLEQNFRISSLTFLSGTGGTPSVVTIGPGTLATNRLDIAPQLATSGTVGITMTAGGPTAVTISSPLKIGAAQTWSLATGTQTLTLSGPLYGDSDLTIVNPGRVVLGAAADSTFNTGTTVDVSVTGGTLELQNGGALGSLNDANLARISLTNSVFFLNSAASGTVDNPLALSNVTLSAGGNAQTYTSGLALSTPLIVNMRDNNGDTTVTTARNITLPGALSGAGQIVVLSSTTQTASNPFSGSLTLSGTNTGWSGGLSFQQGTVISTNTTALGSGDIVMAGAGGRVIMRGTNGEAYTLPQNLLFTGTNAVVEWQVDNVSGTLAADLTATLSGTVTFGTPTSGKTGLRVYMADTSSMAAFTGPIVLANDGSIIFSANAAAGRVLALPNLISGTGSLGINDNFAAWGQTGNTVLISGTANTYTGSTLLGGGTLRFNTVSDVGGGPSSLGQGSALTMSGGGLSFVGDTSHSTTRPLTLSAAATLNAAGSNGATITYSGPITNASGVYLTLTGSGAGTISG